MEEILAEPEFLAAVRLKVKERTTFPAGSAVGEASRRWFSFVPLVPRGVSV